MQRLHFYLFPTAQANVACTGTHRLNADLSAVSLYLSQRAGSMWIISPSILLEAHLILV